MPWEHIDTVRVGKRCAQREITALHYGLALQDRFVYHGSGGDRAVKGLWSPHGDKRIVTQLRNDNISYLRSIFMHYCASISIVAPGLTPPHTLYCAHISNRKFEPRFAQIALWGLSW